MLAASRVAAWSVALALCVTLWAGAARATYSIVAADTRTRATGGAGTSCLSGADVYIIYGAAPGVGTLHAQAELNPDGRVEGLRLFRAGSAPADIIAAITSPDFDPDASVRQYAVVDVTGRVAAFTGADDGTYAGDRHGQVETFVYSVQGNILTGREVVDQAAEAFEAAGCDLPERLMLALEAGAANGQGDRRCTLPRGIPSDSAFLEVDLPDEPEGSYLELRVPTSGSANPLVQLRTQFDTWRATHRCPAPADAGADEPGSGGARAAETPTNQPEGCGCHLPRGRLLGASSVWLSALGLLLLCRAKSPARVRGANQRLS
jgi:uncharacterized Ntn-hydrolase superfamily protein